MPQAKRCEFAKTTLIEVLGLLAGAPMPAVLQEKLERAIDEIFAEAVITAKKEVIEQLENEGRLRRI